MGKKSKTIKNSLVNLSDTSEPESGANINPDSYHAKNIRDENDLIKHLNYIYNNAVKRRFVEVPSEYPWSSANPKFETDVEEILSGSGTSPTTVLGTRGRPRPRDERRGV